MSTNDVANIPLKDFCYDKAYYSPGYQEIEVEIVGCYVQGPTNIPQIIAVSRNNSNRRFYVDNIGRFRLAPVGSYADLPGI